jgi:hypothetical protein
MASCPSCGHARIKKDRSGQRLCRRCGPLPGSARIAAVALVAASLILSGCTGSGVVEGHRYSAYGIVNADDNKNPNIHYRVSVWNAVLAVVLIETVVVPIVVVGWQLFVPVRLENVPSNPNTKGLEP